jgi:lipopolysaccharide export system protein LptA
MKSPITMAVLGAALAAALAALPAEAQLQKNSKEPIDVTADHLETQSADCVAIWTGSAEALQGTSRLRSEVMIAHLEKKDGKSGQTAGGANSGCGQMISLEAKGSVYYVAADGRRVHGDNGFYDAGTKTMTITGDVTAVDGQNDVMRGTKMVYNTDTGEGHVEGGGKGPGAKNRPRGVFYPKDSNSDSQGSTSQGSKGQADKPKKAAK